MKYIHVTIHVKVACEQAHSRVLARLFSLAQIGELASRLMSKFHYSLIPSILRFLCHSFYALSQIIIQTAVHRKPYELSLTKFGE